ncbi:MAG: 2-oxo acid dehydrogenase subunit E2 [Nitrospirae bacterium]|nr:2-oxo acid dehydrogenase subunit E2 [Nitrospirota bacterium]
MEIPLPELAEGVDEAEVVQICVSPGDKIEKGQNLVEVETDKASVPVPSTATGVIAEILVKEGERIQVGKALVALETEAGAAVKGPVPSSPKATQPPVSTTTPAAPKPPKSEVPSLRPPSKEPPQPATPAVGTRLPDFSRWGTVRRVPVSSLRRKIGENVSHSWMTIPHVHQFHEADITGLEALRKRHVETFSDKGIHLTLTVFLLKALVQTLKTYPQFNTSLDIEAGELIQKEYYHIGVAVDTESGLIVPVLRDVDRKGIPELARELSVLSEKTRSRQITPEELQGGTFSLSNLGGIGGSHFTPIIRTPEVAVLGVGRAQERPIFRDHQDTAGRFLPLCLAYDHRVIDGADGARFISHLSNTLENYETLLLGL